MTEEVKYIDVLSKRPVLVDDDGERVVNRRFFEYPCEGTLIVECREDMTGKGYHEIHGFFGPKPIGENKDGPIYGGRTITDKSKQSEIEDFLLGQGMREPFKFRGSNNSGKSITL